MSTQPTIFDAAEGEARKAEGIDRAERGASDDWTFAARNAVRRVIARGQPFTTDDVWAELDRLAVEGPREPRALGAIMRWASNAGLIIATDRTLKSQRPDCHRRPVRIWKPVMP